MKCPRCHSEVYGDYCPSCGLYMKLGQFPSSPEPQTRRSLMIRGVVSSIALVISIALMLFLRTYSFFVEIVAYLMGIFATMGLIITILALREKVIEPWQKYPDARAFSNGEQILCTLFQPSLFIIVTERRFIKLKKSLLRRRYKVVYEVPLSMIDDVTSIRKRKISISSILFITSLSLTWMWIGLMALRYRMLRKEHIVIFWLLTVLPAFIPTSSVYYALIVKGSIASKSIFPAPIEAMDEYEPILEYFSTFISCLIEATRSSKSPSSS